MIMLGAGSFGLQIGGQATDLVLLIMNLSGLETYSTASSLSAETPASQRVGL